MRGAWIGLLALVPVMAQAMEPTMVQQGRLLDASGGPLNGSVTMTFRLYEAEGATDSLWDEEHTLVVSNGYYGVILGEQDPLPMSAIEGDVTPWIGIDIAGAEFQHQQMASVPGAMTAQSAERATLADRATVADTATLADRATQADSATQADTAALADRATLADTATVAESALLADRATTAETAEIAELALEAGTAETATSAGTADLAAEALTALTDDEATTISRTDCAQDQVLSFNGSAWVCTSVPSLTGTRASHFTRWGRVDCPSTSSSVYAGWMATGHYTHGGGPSNVSTRRTVIARVQSRCDSTLVAFHGPTPLA